MSFPFLDLQAQFAELRDEIMAAIAEVMESQQFILGPEVDAFEREVAASIGVRTAISCASGSDALLLALMALGIGHGDEVITTPFTFVATAGAIARLGARPVFVDIAPGTFNIDPTLVRAAVSERTRAIIPVHLFGLAADCQKIEETAKELNLPIVEDAAQAIGARYKGSSAGKLGTIACFSFFPSKNLGGAGDGGMLTTEDPQLETKLRALRAHGGLRKYHYDILGTNSRLDAIQAAILRIKLPYLDKWTRKRRENAERYRQMFAQRGLTELIALPTEPAGYYHVYNQFTIRCGKRDALREFLRDNGIPSEVYYPLPLHLQPAFEYLRHKPGAFPASESASRDVLSLPIYPELRAEHQAAVVDSVARFFGV